MKMIALVLFLTSWLCAQETPTFRSDVRMVEVYATVYDGKNRYVDGLQKQQFRLLDEGKAQEVLAFEGVKAEVSCAVLLDTTGSMQAALPLVKNAMVHLIEALRPDDSIAIYSFGTTLNMLQDFTTDRTAAKRAILRTRAAGQTALFDAVSQVARDISQRQGKKVIIAFTDGADNASVLNARSAVARARKAGVPLYAVAQGDALHSRELMNNLRTLADGSGGALYEAKKSSDIGGIFDDIVQDLQHTYLLAYKPSPLEGDRWHSIQLSVSGVPHHRIRAKEGYLP
jgi:Ca-activated chloride channel family protein